MMRMQKLPIFPNKLKISTTFSTLTHQELQQINNIVPQLLCSSTSSNNNLKDAINLVCAALSTPDPPPLTSLPSLSTLIRRLALEPDLTHPMYLLNTLKYTPHSSRLLIPISNQLVSSFFENNQPKKALKVFQWVLRPDFPGGVVQDSRFYAVLVRGFCRNGMVLEALEVVRSMLKNNLVEALDDEIGTCIYMALLREARVKQAVELNESLVRFNNKNLHGGAKDGLGAEPSRAGLSLNQVLNRQNSDQTESELRINELIESNESVLNFNKNLDDSTTEEHISRLGDLLDKIIANLTVLISRSVYLVLQIST